jgi:hypothetical protein
MPTGIVSTEQYHRSIQMPYSNIYTISYDSSEGKNNILFAHMIIAEA